MTGLPTSPRDGTEEDRARVFAQLKIWRDHLIDLTRANPLLGINRSRTSKLRVTTPSAGQLFDMLVVEGRKLRMPLVRRRPAATIESEAKFSPDEPLPTPWTVQEGDVQFEAEPPDIFRRLRRIRDNARTTIEERGVTTLHVTVGAVQWDDPFLGDSVAPLWLIPCAFENKGPDDSLLLQATDEDAQLNPALAIYLRERFKKDLPVLPEEPSSGVIGELLRQTGALLSSEWHVTDEAWLSTFSFETLTIYQDLGTLAEAAASSDIVRAFAGASLTLAPEPSERLGDDLDAVPTTTVHPVPVMPADSSQLEALAYARLGRHVLVHGPPGTGKSQTIANLIAGALGHGETVLFVSEKMAALEVVYDRLAKLGLGRFCLEAHSTKAGRKRIIDELRRTLDAASVMSGAGHRSDLARYTALRELLNQTVREMHCERAPLRCSVYQALGRYARLEHLPAVTSRFPWSDPTAVTEEELQQALDTLADLQVQAPIFAERDTHPWRGYTARDATFGTLQELTAALTALKAAGEAILGAATALEPLLGPLSGRSLQDLERATDALHALSEAIWLPDGWINHAPAHLDETAKLLEAAAERTATLAEARARFAQLTDDADPAAALDVLAPALDRFAGWYKRVLPAYFSWKLAVRNTVRPKADDYASLTDLARLARRIADQVSWLEEHQSVLSLVRNPMGGAVPDAEAQRDAALAFKRAAAIHRGRGQLGARVPDVQMQRVNSETRSAAATLLRQLPSAQSGLAQAIARLEDSWTGGFIGELSATQAPSGSLLARCAEALAAPQRLPEWVLFKETLDRCHEAGLAPFVEALSPHGSRTAVDIFRRHLWLLWSDAHIARTPALNLFSGAKRQQLIDEFRSLDQALRQAAAEAAAHGAAQRAAQISQSGYAAPRSQLGVLRRELQKKRPRPLRRFFADIPQVLQAIKPCMLMSPVSVSTYLTPGSISFDVVVFDEASQIPPQEAIPSILRASQVVVAGDDKQLPPTSFFSSSLFAEEDEDDEGADRNPLESLLHECQATVPLFQPSSLRWHYRSRDERLIAFSNHTFYEGGLITFPPPGNRDDCGVKLHFVENGVYDRGRSRTNRAEARAVADIVMSQLDGHPERSIGVVAMNVSQKEAIEDALDEALLMRADLRERLVATHGNEPFFIKSLENVQGDERDTIVISVGYGPDSSGTLNLNFGPLNQEGGWRRLNVLVTRAKYLTVLVTSLRSSDLGAVAPDNRGATALRQYIEYGERGGRLTTDAARLTGAETNDFEDAIGEALRARGVTVDEQVGASSFRIDLAVRDPRDPNWYMLGIECDGATYHSSRSARDRDLLRAEMLRGMGWRLHRIWSVDWFRNPQESIDAAVRAVERAQALGGPETGVSAPSAEPASPAPPRVEPGPPPTTPPRAVRTLTYPAGVPYRGTPPHGRRDRDLLLEESMTSRLADEIVRVVQAEEPIHADLAVERLKKLHGVARAGRNVRSNFAKALARVTRGGLIHRDKQSFLWVKPGTLGQFRVPDSAADTRAIQHIPLEEIRLAVLHIAESQFGLPRADLVRETAGLLGFGRASAEIFDRIADVVDTLIEQGELRVSGLQVRLP